MKRRKYFARIQLNKLLTQTLCVCDLLVVDLKERDPQKTSSPSTAWIVLLFSWTTEKIWLGVNEGKTYKVSNNLERGKNAVSLFWSEWAELKKSVAPPPLRQYCGLIGKDNYFAAISGMNPPSQPE